MKRSSLRWLDVVRHRVQQHPDIPSATTLAASITLPLRGDVDAIAPRLLISDIIYHIRLLDITAIPRDVLGDTIMSATNDGDAIMAALDIILHGYPVGRPF